MIGTRIGEFENLTSLNARIAELDEPKDEPVFDAAGNELKRHKAIVSGRTGEILSVLTKKYTIVQSKDVLSEMAQHLQNMGIHEVSGEIIEQNNGRVFAKIFLPKYTINDGSSDILLGFQIRNSYDAYIAIHVEAIAKRLVCSNGMTATDIIGAAYIRKHMGICVQEERIKEAVSDVVEKIVERSPYMQQIIEQTIKEFLDKTKIEAILSDYGYGPRMIDNIMEEVNTMNKISRWDLYNIITEFLTQRNVSEDTRNCHLRKAEKMLIKA